MLAGGAVADRLSVLVRGFGAALARATAPLPFSVAWLLLLMLSVAWLLLLIVLSVAWLLLLIVLGALSTFGSSAAPFSVLSPIVAPATLHTRARAGVALCVP